MSGFERFYLETKDKFFGYLLKLTGNSEEASDILQETYLRLFKNYKERPVKALLYRIGYNIFIDTRRRLKHQGELEDFSNMEDTNTNVVSSYIKREEFSSVMKLLQRLSVEERNILSLRSSDNLSYKEIAEITGMSEENVKVKIHRIRKKLKNMMKEEGLL